MTMQKWFLPALLTALATLWIVAVVIGLERRSRIPAADAPRAELNAAIQPQ